MMRIGVAVGMSDDNDGTAGLAGLVSWLMITTSAFTGMLSRHWLALHRTASRVDPAFAKITERSSSVFYRRSDWS